MRMVSNEFKQSFSDHKNEVNLHVSPGWNTGLIFYKEITDEQRISTQNLKKWVSVL